VTARRAADRPVDPSSDITYVYCLVQAVRPPSLRGVPGSLPGAGAPRILPIERDVWAVVAHAPLGRFSGEALQQEMQDVEGISRHAIAHAAVIEFFFRRAPVIPLKLFTLFSSDENARTHVRSRLTALRKMFAGLRGLEEWGVRIIAGEVAAGAARTLESGRDYLQLKRRLRDQTTAPSRATIRVIDGALRSVGRLASKKRTDPFPPPGPGRPYVSGASFLVKATRRREWKKHVATIAASLAAHGHQLEMSGPWPPYHFVSK
jgi:hypothetical protein